MKKSKMKKKLILNKMSIALLDNEEKFGVKGGVKTADDVMEADAPGTTTCKTIYVPLCLGLWVSFTI